MLWNSFLFSCRRWHFLTLFDLFCHFFGLFFHFFCLYCHFFGLFCHFLAYFVTFLAYFVTSFHLFCQFLAYFVTFLAEVVEKFFPRYGIVSNFWQYIHPWSHMSHKTHKAWLHELSFISNVVIGGLVFDFPGFYSRC